jgi:hypothetical protein
MSATFTSRPSRRMKSHLSRLFVFPLPLFAFSHLGFRLRFSIPCLFTSCLFFIVLSLFYFISLSLFFLIYYFSVRVCFLDGPSGFHGIGPILPQVMTFERLDGSPCSQSIPIQSKTLSRISFWAASFTRFSPNHIHNSISASPKVPLTFPRVSHRIPLPMAGRSSHNSYQIVDRAQGQSCFVIHLKPQTIRVHPHAQESAINSVVIQPTQIQISRFDFRSATSCMGGTIDKPDSPGRPRLRSEGRPGIPCRYKTDAAIRLIPRKDVSASIRTSWENLVGFA